MTTIYVPLMDSPSAGAAQLDSLNGQVVVLAGLDRPEAVAAFGLYQASSIRTGAAFDAAALRITHGASVIQFAWETDISTGQDVVWTTIWTHLAIEDRLFPSKYLTDTIEAIIRTQKAA